MVSADNGGYMSEKYSTEELIKIVLLSIDRPRWRGAADLVIARLRAADKLLSMMRLIKLQTDESGEMWFSIFNEGGRSASINVTLHGPIVRGALADFEVQRIKAIADYEGKEKK
jgi:hypothetical protein